MLGCLRTAAHERQRRGRAHQRTKDKHKHMGVFAQDRAGSAKNEEQTRVRLCKSPLKVAHGLIPFTRNRDRHRLSAQEAPGGGRGDAGSPARLAAVWDEIEAPHC